MALETIIIGAAVLASVAASAYAMLQAPKSSQKMKQSIGDMSVTRAEEGQCIPIVYGTVRVPGSIIWYGNLKTKEMPTPGGKGAGASEGTGNYRVYIDAHFVLCEGKITLENVYRDEEDYDYSASLTFNDGTTTLYENYAAYTNKMPGVAHIYFKGWYLGENTYSIPSLSFQVKRVLTTPLTSTVTTGENPACIVWDLLSKTSATLDTSSFQAAADYFNTRDIGLNIVFNEQQEVSKLLETVFAHVDLVLYSDNGTYYLKAITESQIAVADIADADTKELTFSRVAYNQVFNDLAANYVDTSNTQRTVRLINEAVYSIVNERKNHSYDFKCFSSLDVVKARLSEMLKRDSYPLSEVSFTTSLQYYSLQPGDVFTLDSTALGMTDKKFRVTKIEKNPFRNEVKITAREHTYDMVDAYYYDVGLPLWTDPNIVPADLDYVKAIQACWGKYREWNGRVPVLILPVRKLGAETGYDVYYSLDGTGYQFIATCHSFAYPGVLEEAYTADTYPIDDDIGILMSYDETALVYSLDSITRGELFTTKRMIVIDNEAMKFQTVTEESSNYRLTGVLRDERYQASHADESRVYISEVNDNVLYLPAHTQIYLKICPRTFRGVLPLADATAIEFTPNIAPEPVSRIKATRTSTSNITLEIWPNINRNQGCGIGSADIITDTIPHPFISPGSLLLQIDSDPQIVLTTTTYSFTKSGACDVTVWHQDHGSISTSKVLSIGADDGEYII